MNSITIEKRMEAIKEEHDKLVDECEQIQAELNKKLNRRIQLEGAFVELSNLREAAKHEEADEEDVSK